MPDDEIAGAEGQKELLLRLKLSFSQEAKRPSIRKVTWATSTTQGDGMLAFVCVPENGRERPNFLSVGSKSLPFIYKKRKKFCNEFSRKIFHF